MKTCPLCHGNSKKLWVQVEIPIRQCDACGHQFADCQPGSDHIAQTYGDEYFFGGGDGYADYLADGDLLRTRGRWYAQRIRRHVAGGQMLDVGAAAGFILAGFRDEGWEGIGVEPNRRMAEYARDRLGLNVIWGSVEESLPRAEQATLDLVVVVQVLAHFIWPDQAIERAVAGLRQGGYCLMETWDRESRTARRSGPNWHEYNPPSVLHWFSRDSVRDLMARHGFQWVDGGRPRKWISCGHAKTVLSRTAAEAGLASTWLQVLVKTLPNRWCFPYLGDDVFWGLFRRG